MDLHHLHHDHHHSDTTTTYQNLNPSRAEAERLLGIAEKLLQTRDLTGSREFALLAQETEPLLEGSDQILAITDVLLASEHRVVNNRHHDWYNILQINRHSLSSEPDLLKKNYRRLALLLHPDKNRYPLSDSAFKLVADAWALLSDPSRKAIYDHELTVYSKVELRHQPPHSQQYHHPQPQTAAGVGAGAEKDKLPVRRSPRKGFADGGDGGGNGLDSSDPSPPPGAFQPRGSTVGGGRGGGAAGKTNFWTACPYCYVLYEFPRAYEDCCLRCQNCERAYHASVINSLPPVVPGKEAYYCCWGFFPLGFSLDTATTAATAATKGKKKVVGSDTNHDGVTNNVNGNNHPNNDNANNNNNNNPNSGFPNWMPAGIFSTPPVAAAAVPQGGGGVPNVNNAASVGGGVDISDGSASAGFGNNNINNNNNNISAGYGGAPPGMGSQAAKKRGRPRKNPLPL
ncbi:uncharacterized protein [Spinacia oleracea]|uniref:J domain-containing protein n=1 Tax=Spinacia oleracea TaxID=3562 RepID=A0A9R0K6J8_SPIOL|nr:uncharacterized protein LOC110799368 [Spinacia oleracea]